MILRRFMQHVKEQNWFAVGLDIIVVIVGIFLGMQVTEWNEDRLDRKLERDYLVRILEDLDSSLKFQESDINFMQTNFSNLEFVIDTLNEGKLEQKQKQRFNIGLATSAQINPIRYVQTAFSELISTGQVRLIQNVELRNTLSELGVVHSYKQQQMQYPYDYMKQSREQIIENYYVHEENGGSYDFGALSQSPQFLLHLQHISQNFEYIILFHSDFQRETKKTRTHVELYLKQLNSDN